MDLTAHQLRQLLPWGRRKPDRVIVIASLPRSGSTLLSEGLARTGKVGSPSEYFNEVMGDLNHYGSVTRRLIPRSQRLSPSTGAGHTWFQAVRDSPPAMARYRDDVLASSMSPNGIASIRIHWDDFAPLAGTAWDPRAWDIDVSWIAITRSDVVRQAISYERASQSGAWTSRQAAHTAPAYDFTALHAQVDRMRQAAAGWSAFFAEGEVAPVAVRYEDLSEDYQGELQRVLRQLGIEGARTSAPPLARQADDVTEEWVARYEADLAGTRSRDV